MCPTTMVRAYCRLEFLAMSYSRWSTSKFYTYYACSYSIEKEGQTFDICSVRCFTYEELTSDLAGCLKIVSQITPSTEEELEELKGYIIEFIDDVDSDKDLALVEQIKSADLKDLPGLAQALRDQTVGNYNAEDYEDFLDDLDLIIKTPETQIDSITEDIKTDLGKLIHAKKVGTPHEAQINRFDILKNPKV